MKKHSILGEHVSGISNLFDKVKKSNEFEIDLNMNKMDVTYERYIDIMRYLTHIHTVKNLDLQKSTSLDITYSEIDDIATTSYRISIHGKWLINKYIALLQSRRSHVVFNVMMNIIKDKKYSDSISVTKKTKLRDNTIDIPDLNMRIRLATEEQLTKKDIDSFVQLNETHLKHISFRFKQRVSLTIEKTQDYNIQIDLTNVKTAYRLDRIDASQSMYELEVECTTTDAISNKPEVLDKIMIESESLLKVIQQSNYIITKTQMENVLSEYKRLLSISDKTVYNLEGRAPVSLEIQYATETLQNKYAVVDKADGDRYFMIICFNHVYLISQNLRIKDTGIEIQESKESKNSINGTIFDCEYVYLPKFKRYAILPFDCLFAREEDIRKNPNLLERVAIAQSIVADNFVFGKQKGFNPIPLKTKNTVENIMKYYISQLDEHVNALIHDAEYEKQYPLIRVKYFMPVYGLADNEVFKYSMIVWNKYMYDEIKYPYSLDGIIYQPLNQAYVTNVKESKFSDYKWKPQEKNTIDFYIRFERDRNTGKIVNVFDNSNDEHTKNKPYRICYLYNGKRTRDGETPVYFNEEKGLHIAHLFLEDGNVKDSNGDIIQDGTVVEFYYNNNLDMNEKFRWIPLKTRYDKTEMVNRFGIKYGNSIDIATRIWRSIIIPVRISDIATLSDDELYTKHLSEMRGKVTQELIISAAKENVYYQVKTNLAKPMRNFHNWIKSILIFTYMHPNYNNSKPLTVLDVGCGVGGDLMKFYHAKVASCVGIDISFDNLHNAVDGAISRYNKDIKKYPAFPRMNFVCADFTVPLDAESQLNVVSDKTPNNKYLLEKIFPKTNMTQFDRLNIQFAFHYFLANERTWKVTCDNINKCLRPGGYLVMTTFDAKVFLDTLGKESKYTLYYTTNGEKKILMDFVRKFPEKQTSGVGMAIDVYNSLISSEDVYITEYLVDKDFIVSELKQKCNMELVDTDMFDRQFEVHKDNITRISNFDENDETKKFLQTVATFYDQQNEVNAECFKISRLNRYYCFRKNE